MKRNLLAGLCCWGVVLTATAVIAGSPARPEINRPQTLKAIPDLSLERTPKKLPDLIIGKFGLKKWGRCEPKQTIFEFQADVANVGTAGSPAGVQLEVQDQHGVGWGNRVSLGPIPAGGHQAVTIPIPSFNGRPPHALLSNLHPFQARVDPGNTLPELSEINNESAVVQVDTSKICKAPAVVDLKIKRAFVVTVVDGVPYTGVHASQVPVGTFFDLCCEFAVVNATPPLPQDWKIGLFLDGGLHASVSGNNFSATGHVCHPGGTFGTPAAHGYECVLDHTGLVPESSEANNRGSAPFSIIP